MKLFTEKQVGVGTFLGGPIPAGIMIYLNYKSLGKDYEANISMAITLLFSSLFFYFLVITPIEVLDQVPDLIFTSVIALISYIIYRNFMSDLVETSLSDGAQIVSNWRVAGITTLGVGVTFLIGFGFAFSQNLYPGEAAEFDGNTIYYETDYVTNDILKLTAQELTGVEYFAPDYGNEVHLTYYGDTFVLTVPVQKEYWDEVKGPLYYVQQNLESSTGMPFMIRMESFGLSGENETRLVEF